jgi:hypothetical protein
MFRNFKNRKHKGCGFVLCKAITNFSKPFSYFYWWKKYSSIMGVFFCNHHERPCSVGFSFFCFASTDATISVQS